MIAAAARKSKVRLPLGRAHCFDVLATSCKPRDRLTVSQWADKHRWLSGKQSGEKGKWVTARNPILREIMDALSATSRVREVVVMKSSQVGVTEATVNWLGYILDHAPAPTMVLMPTLESRDRWKVQKLNPLLTETETVRAILGGMRSRDAANRQDMIDFPGGILFLAGGNSPNSYAQSTVRFLVMDDLDRFPAEVGTEGDPVLLARGRMKAMERSKLLLISTPTVKDASLIEREYLASDQRRYHVACPACSAPQHLKWSNVRWNPVITAAWYECEHCGHEIQEHHKPKMLANGRWIAEKPEVLRRGYHISALYAPIGLGPSWLDLAQEWKSAHQDNATLKAFINTHLGETWADTTNKLKPHELSKRCEDVPPRTIPIGCLALTIGIDTQDKWLAVTLLGHGPHHLWVLEYLEISGDTMLATPWDQLEAYINTVHRNAFGKEMRPRAAAIDSRGHRGEQVRNFVARRSLQIPVYSVQGSTTRMQRPVALSASFPDKDKKGKAVKDGYGVWNVGTEHCKDYILGRLTTDSELPREAGVIRFPAFPKELREPYFNGLLSEVYDPEKRRYVQKKGAAYKRNEPLDTFVYAWAIAAHRNVMLGRFRNGKIDPNYWTRLEAILEPDGSVVHVPAEQGAQEALPPPPAAPQQPRRHHGRRVIGTG